MKTTSTLLLLALLPLLNAQTSSSVGSNITSTASLYKGALPDIASLPDTGVPGEAYAIGDCLHIWSASSGATVTSYDALGYTTGLMLGTSQTDYITEGTGTMTGVQTLFQELFPTATITISGSIVNIDGDISTPQWGNVTSPTVTTGSPSGETILEGDAFNYFSGSPLTPWNVITSTTAGWVPNCDTAAPQTLTTTGTEITLTDGGGTVTFTPTLEPEYEFYSYWAEENGGLSSGSWAYSWGNGATGYIGLPVGNDNELISFSLHADTAGGNHDVTIGLYDIQNTASNAAPLIYSYTLTDAGEGTANNAHGYTDLRAAPVTIPDGAVLAFRTITEVGAFTDVRVGIQIRRPTGRQLMTGLVLSN